VLLAGLEIFDSPLISCCSQHTSLLNTSSIHADAINCTASFVALTVFMGLSVLSVVFVLGC
jgi:hypothetical protein